MCGIVGYIGEEQAAPILLNGLQKLEYRGYDSAGVAVYNDTGVHVVKSKGRLSVLDGILQGGKELPGTVGIGHTRWATHGAPSDVNSHPQVSDGGLFAVVLGITVRGKEEALKQETDYQFCVPDITDFMLPSLSILPLQLFAYYVASMKGYDIDKSGTLNKSVTVEKKYSLTDL